MTAADSIDAKRLSFPTVDDSIRSPEVPALPQPSSQQPRFDLPRRWQRNVIHPTPRERAVMGLMTLLFVSWSSVLVWIAVRTL